MTGWPVFVWDCLGQLRVYSLLFGLILKAVSFYLSMGITLAMNSDSSMASVTYTTIQLNY